LHELFGRDHPFLPVLTTALINESTKSDVVFSTGTGGIVIPVQDNGEGLLSSLIIEDAGVAVTLLKRVASWRISVNFLVRMCNTRSTSRLASTGLPPWLISVEFAKAGLPRAE